MSELPPVQRFESSSGVRIYRISCHAFPRLITHVYLLVGAGPVTLVDTGSGVGDSTAEVFAGLNELRPEFGEPVGPADIERIIITHGHHDHFGGLANFRGKRTARVGIHPLDRWVLTAYEERLVVATHAIRLFLRRAGCSGAKEQSLLEMYLSTKRLVHSQQVDFPLDETAPLDGLEFIHVPGHCPGQVCIRIGDVLLTADHVLPRTTPHQSPESITASTGLGHYFESLDRIGRLTGIRLCLGGHEEPFSDLAGRVAEIRVDHLEKLERIRLHFEQAGRLTIDELTERMYPGVEGWNVLLAIEEVGAHVEYLYERGELSVVNLEELSGLETGGLQFRARG
jgi:glyoxylase-like metal-dependent hydrolase (beta-lactamase superfamily II)